MPRKATLFSVRAAERDRLQAVESCVGQGNVADDLPDARRSRSHNVSALRSASSRKSELTAIGAVGQRRRADEARIAARAVDLFLHAEDPAAAVRGILRGRFLLQHHRAQEILLRQQQLRFAVAVHIRGAHPRLFHAAAGRRNVLFVKILARRPAAAP